MTSSIRSTVDAQTQLPQGLLDAAPQHAINNRAELVRFWRQVLLHREQFPDLQENIAIFAVSIGATLPLTDDNDIFEAVHAQFGMLEVPQVDRNDDGWAQVTKLIDLAEAEAEAK